MDSSAKNYNSSANKDDGSCIYYEYGCTDSSAKNYNMNAEKDDESCIYYKYGCTDKQSINYDETAEKDDGSCIPIVYGCTDEKADNYNVEANRDDGNCQYKNTEVDNNSHSNTDSLLGIGIIGITCYILYKTKFKKNNPKK